MMADLIHGIVLVIAGTNISMHRKVIVSLLRSGKDNLKFWEFAYSLQYPQLFQQRLLDITLLTMFSEWESITFHHCTNIDILGHSQCSSVDAELL